MSDVRILLVEDNPDDELLTLRALKKANFANPVTVARDGAEALELLIGSRAMPFGLVLLDLRLPKVHGLEVLQRIRADERTKLTRVVVLTTSAEEPDVKSAYAYGASGYVRKPVNFQDFVSTVTQLGMYWLVINELPPRSSGSTPSPS
jgi:two-component system response regulator